MTSGITTSSQGIVWRLSGGVWTIVQTVPGTILADLTPVGATSIWAVGTAAAAGAGGVLDHRNGSTWAQVSTLSSMASAALNGVIRVPSTATVWVVGTSPRGPFSDRYNGSTWTTVSPVDPGPTGGAFASVAASSASNVYAVGSYYAIQPGSSLVLSTLVERYH